MTTTVVFADTADGSIISTDTAGVGEVAWDNARGGGANASLAVDTTVGSHIHGYRRIAASDYAIHEIFMGFDTSAIGGDTVSAVTLSLNKVQSNSDDGSTDGIRLRVYDFGGTVDTGDWRAVTGTSAGDTLVATCPHGNHSGSGVGSYIDFTSNGSFPAAINGSGTTYLYTVGANAEDDVRPGTNSIYSLQAISADGSGTTFDPKLTITHAPASAAATKMHHYRQRRV